jgi:hypothetical protein
MKHQLKVTVERCRKANGTVQVFFAHRPPTWVPHKYVVLNDEIPIDLFEDGKPYLVTFEPAWPRDTSEGLPFARSSL